METFSKVTQIKQCKKNTIPQNTEKFYEMNVLNPINYGTSIFVNFK